MAAQMARLRVTRIGEVTQVEFVDRNILDESNIQQISEELTSVVDELPTPKVLIRFSNVDHLSSAALGAMITINNRVRGKDGLLKLSEIAPQIREVFTITKLDKIFEIYDVHEDALKSFA